jgi:hypothetical protein
MEFLENNSSGTSIAKIDDLEEFFESHGTAHQTFEDVYDYWLDRRLNKKGKKLIPHVEVGGDCQIVKAFKKMRNDPYVAFRPRVEKMRLRKNRSNDCKNYQQMLQLKIEMEPKLKDYASYVYHAQMSHDRLKEKFDLFTRQYEKQDFDSYPETDPHISDLTEENDCDTNRFHDFTSELATNESDDPFQFLRRHGHSYHKVISFTCTKFIVGAHLLI